MCRDRVHLREASLEDVQTLSFLHKILWQDKETKYIWNISDKAALWDDLDSLKTFLINDFKISYIYIAYCGEEALGLFGALNISVINKSANLLIWIDKSVRNRTFLMRWWTCFLLEIQKNRIERVHAKIKKKNVISLNTAIRCGFQKYDFMPVQYDGFENVCPVSRTTTLNSFEKKYFSRFWKHDDYSKA